MLRNYKGVILSVATSALLAGCASTTHMNTYEADAAITRLTEVAETIQDHHNDLSDIEAARYIEDFGRQPEDFDVSYIPGLQKLVSLGAPWHGPIEPLVTKLSKIAGLEKPLEIGVKPTGDVLIHVGTDYRRVIDILHDAGTQAGSRADVTVKVKDRRIQIEYYPY